MKPNLSASDIGIKASGSADSDDHAESDEVVEWLKELDEARKREKDFRREGNRIVSIYEGSKKEVTPFNILYSNTETLMPALYNSTPTPVVQRRFKDEDQLGKMASMVTERALKYLIDDGNTQYTSFDDLMKSATLEALLPGRGLTRFKYDAQLEKAENVAAAKMVEADGVDDPDDKPTEVEVPETVKYETVCGEEVPWDRFLHGNAKKWKDVPWLAFEHFMTREELKGAFGKLGAKVPVTELIKDDDQDVSDSDSITKSSASGTAGVKVAQVFEVWDKIQRKVVFISPQWKAGPLKKVADPLKLTGFYPCPKPLTFIGKVSTLTPVAVYTLYEEQAKELNRITIRINKLIVALKVRGLYDSTVEGIEKVMKADDNVLIPAENVAAMLAQGNPLEKAIFLMPIEKLVTVLQQLYIQREQVKTIIYELTGVADIMRGSSQASETLGAQKLKNQWGTLRLKKTQKEVMRYARESLRIIAEIAISKLSTETLKAMTGLPYPTGEEKAQAQALAQQVQQQQMQMAQQAQMAGQPPPAPQPPPPEIAQALALPSWDELLTLLRDDSQRSYRVDIETNSTVDAEATEDKEDISELLNAISQFLNGVGPMVKDGTLPFEVAQGMLLAVVRRYRFGPELEDQLKKMKPPAPNADPAAAEKAQAEVQKAMEKLKQAEEAFGKQQQQAQLALDKQVADLELEKRQFAMEQQFAAKELAMEKQFAQRELQLQEKVAQKNVELASQSSEQKLALKASFQGEDIKRKGEDLKRKEQSIKQPTAQEVAATISEPLMQGLTVLAEKISEGIVQAAKVQKVAKKQADGSWATSVT